MANLKPASGTCRTTSLLILLVGILSVQAHAVEISLQTDDWHVFKYQTIPSHRLTQESDGMKVIVKRSASPVIHAFAAPMRARSLSVRARIIGQLDLAGKPQGSKGADDFRLRVGVVYSGARKLDPFQLSIAPGWVKQIYSLLPENTGISHVQFFNTYLDEAIAGIDRTHPTTPLWKERFTLQVSQNGTVAQRLELDPDYQVVGIWISVDGDDTGSCFDVVLQQLELDSQSAD